MRSWMRISLLTLCALGGACQGDAQRAASPPSRPATLSTTARPVVAQLGGTTPGTTTLSPGGTTPGAGGAPGGITPGASVAPGSAVPGPGMPGSPQGPLPASTGANPLTGTPPNPLGGSGTQGPATTPTGSATTPGTIGNATIINPSTHIGSPVPGTGTDITNTRPGYLPPQTASSTLANQGEAEPTITYTGTGTPVAAGTR